MPISFTLTSHSRGFTRSRSTRTFLVATDMAKYSVNAIHWTLESLLEDGDEVVILRVIEPGSGVAGKAWEGREGPEEAREDAEEVLDGVMLFNAEKRKVSPRRWLLPLMRAGRCPSSSNLSSARSRRASTA